MAKMIVYDVPANKAPVGPIMGRATIVSIVPDPRFEFTAFLLIQQHVNVSKWTMDCRQINISFPVGATFELHALCKCWEPPRG